MRALLLGSLLLFACTQGVLPGPTASTTPGIAATASATASPAPCEGESLQAADDFVRRFNSRDLAGLTALFTVDAQTYWLRRGDPVANDFKEGGRELIRAMLAVRMGDGEILTYDRIDPDPSPKMGYADGTGQWIVSPRFVGLRGAFPDGAARMLGTKFVYACGQRGILQLLILAAG